MVLSPVDAYTVVHVTLTWNLQLGTVAKYVVALSKILGQAPFIHQLVVPIY